MCVCVCVCVCMCVVIFIQKIISFNQVPIYHFTALN